MDNKRLVKTFLELIKIDSPSGHEERVGSYVSNFLIKLGLRPFQDKRGNLIVKVKGVGEPLLLGAHLDTVEPGRGIRPQVKDKIIKSDGTTILGADNKVAVAAILEALTFLAENKFKIRLLDIVFTLSEETDFGSAKLDYRKITAKKGYIFDSLTPLGSIITASPFCNDLQITIIGRSAHSSLPGEAINALKVLARAISEIRLGRINHKTIANIGIVNSGHASNTIPGEAMIRGEVRSFSKKEVTKYSNLIIDKFKEIASQFGAKIERKIVESCPGYEYPENDEFVKATKKIIEKFGLKPVLVKKWACSDANIFNAHGIKVLNLGDGVVSPHTINESVSVKDVISLAELILILVK